MRMEMTAGEQAVAESLLRAFLPQHIKSTYSVRDGYVFDKIQSIEFFRGADEDQTTRARVQVEFAKEDPIDAFTADDGYFTVPFLVSFPYTAEVCIDPDADVVREGKIGA